MADATTGPGEKPATKAKRGAAPRKRKAAPRPAAGPISLRWELAELPSSQHRAGLAGLALCVKFLARKPDRKGVCEIEALDAAGLTLRVDAEGMQSLFDDVYAASLEEQARDKKLEKKKADGTKHQIEPKREVTVQVTDKKGQTKAVIKYVYDQVIPAGALHDDWDAGSEGGKKLWLKLWRDVVWSALRGIPATREPYDARAEARAVDDGREAWTELASAPTSGVDLPSTYYLGAQAQSAENVTFRDVARFKFLLHFWPFCVSIYVPAVLKRDDSGGSSRDLVGHAIALPDVANLAELVQDWPQVMRERGTEPSGYVPRDAVIDLAAEGGLDLTRRALGVLGRRQGDSRVQPWLTAVDVFHIEKEGNNVRIRGVGRVDATRERSDAYARSRESYWSPLFRRQRVLNVLDDRQWWHGFGRLCSTSPIQMTNSHGQFQHDCRVAFTEVEMKQDVNDKEKTLEHRIYRAVQSYVFGKLDAKHQLKWNSELAKNDSWKREFDEKKEKVAREAFLAVRSRTGADFVSYFTSTLCSVPQRLGEQGYLDIARALTDEQQVERVRSLTLLALSAHA